MICTIWKRSIDSKNVTTASLFFRCCLNQSIWLNVILRFLWLNAFKQLLFFLIQYSLFLTIFMLQFDLILLIATQLLLHLFNFLLKLIKLLKRNWFFWSNQLRLAKFKTSFEVTIQVFSWMICLACQCWNLLSFKLILRIIKFFLFEMKFLD